MQLFILSQALDRLAIQCYRSLGAEQQTCIISDALRIGVTLCLLIANKVIQHLTKLLVGAKAEIALDIQTVIPDGVPEQIVRTVTETTALCISEA